MTGAPPKMVEVEVTTFLQPSQSWMPPLYPPEWMYPPPGLDTPPVSPLQGLNEPSAPPLMSSLAWLSPLHVPRALDSP